MTASRLSVTQYHTMMLLSSALVCIFFSFIRPIESVEKCNCTKIKMFLGDDTPMTVRDVACTNDYLLAASEFPTLDEVSSITVYHSKIMNHTCNFTTTGYNSDGKKVARTILLVTSFLQGEKPLNYMLSEDFAAYYIIPCFGKLIAAYICQKAGKSGIYPELSIYTPISNKNVNEGDLQKCKLLLQERLGKDYTFKPLTYPPERHCNC